MSRYWVATLHPENADVQIDERFFIPGNPWWTLYENTKAEIPTATAVAVGHDDETEECNPVPPQKPHYIYLCSPINMLVGTALALGAILGVLITEILAFAFYIVAFLMYWIARLFNPDNMFTAVFHSIFMLLYSACSLADSVCLLTSVLVTELLAGTCWIVTNPISGIWMANHWHQYIRRVCHYIRYAFRSPFEQPPRHFADLCMPNLRAPSEATSQVHPTKTMAVVVDASVRNAEPTPCELKTVEEGRK